MNLVEVIDRKKTLTQPMDTFINIDYISHIYRAWNSSNYVVNLVTRGFFEVDENDLKRILDACGSNQTF